MLVCVCLQFVAWQPEFQRPISHSISGVGDYKVAGVGRPAINYKIVVRPWESGIRSCISCNYSMCVCVCVLVFLPMEVSYR